MFRLVIFLGLVSNFCFGAEAKKPFTCLQKKGTFYFYWGYNRSKFSKSDIHFKGPNYDFTLYGLTATDRPTAIGSEYYVPPLMTIPQYNYRLGYFLTNSLAVSFGMDHMKYVVEQNQMTEISGIVTETASPLYVGTYFHQPIKLTRDVLMFEHTNGFNLFSIDFEFLPHLVSYSKWKLTGYWNLGLGGIWVVTKTDVRVFGDGIDNDFHVSGWALTGKTGPRVEYNNRLFLSFECRAGYASLPDVLIKNSAPERADHNVKFLEYYTAIGYNFHLGKRNSNF